MKEDYKNIKNMLNSKMKYYLISILCFFLMSQSMAQEVLSLEDAISKALANNYDIRVQRNNIEIANNNNTLGEAGFLPNVSLQVNQNNSLIDNVKIATPFSLQGQIVSNSVNPQLLLNWQLFKGFSAHISKSRLAALQEEASGNADIVVANTIQAVILGYYRAVLEAERLEEFEKQMKFSADRYNYVKIKESLGSAVSNEMLLEETNYLTDSADYINQILNFENAIRDLNFIMGVEEVDTPYELVNELLFEPKEYLYEELSGKMFSNNVDLRKQFLSNAIVEYDMALRKADRYPTLSFNAGYSNNRSLNNLSSAYQYKRDSLGNLTETREYGPSEPLAAITDNYYANFSLSLTLFNGNRIKRAIENAMIRQDIQNISTDKLQNSLSRDLAKAVANYNVKKQLYQVNAKKEEVAELNLELSEERYKNGTINSFDYRTVQNNYLMASMQKLLAMYNLIDAEVSIMRLTGDLLEKVQ